MRTQDRTDQTIGPKRLLAVLGILLLGLAGRAAGYELFTWRWADSDMPIPYYVNTASIPSSYGGTVTAETFADAVHGAFDAWQDVPDSYITFEHEGTGTAHTPYVEDGHNTIGFASLLNGDVPKS